MKTKIGHKLDSFLSGKDSFDTFIDVVRDLRQQRENVTDARIYQDGTRKTVAGVLAQNGSIEALKEWREQGENVTDAVIDPNGVRVAVAGVFVKNGLIEALKEWREQGGNVTDAQIYPDSSRITVAGAFAQKGSIEALKEWREQGENVTDAQIYPNRARKTVAGVLAQKDSIEALKEWREQGENVTDAVIWHNGSVLTVAGVLAYKGHVEALKEWRKQGENVTDAQINSNGVRKTVADALAQNGHIEALKEWRKQGENVTDAQIYPNGTKLTVAGALAQNGKAKALKEWNIKLTGGGEVTALGQALLAKESSPNTTYRDDIGQIAAAQNQGLDMDETRNVVFIDHKKQGYSADIQNHNRQEQFSLGQETLRKMFREGASVSGFDSRVFDPFRVEMLETLPEVEAIYGLLPQKIKKHDKTDTRPTLPPEIKEKIAEYITGETLESTYSKEKNGQTSQEGILPSKQSLTRDGFCSLYIDQAYNKAFDNYRDELPIDRRAALDSVPHYPESSLQEFRGKLKKELKAKDPDSTFANSLNGSKVPFEARAILKREKLSLSSTGELSSYVEMTHSSAKHDRTEKASDAGHDQKRHRAR